MEYSQEYRDRLQLFRDRVAGKKTHRVPIMSKIVTWHILDCGYKFSEAMSNYEKMEKIVREFHNRYQFDAYIAVTARNPVAITNALGGGFYVIDDEKERINYFDHVLMDGSEYGEFIQDPAAFRWKMFKRKYPEVTKMQVAEAVNRFVEYINFSSGMIEKFITEYNRPAIFNPNISITSPFEHFYSNYRGIKEISIDLRKHKNELKEAMDLLYETENIPNLDRAMKEETSSYVCDVYLNLLGHSILNIKQFEELYWPYLKRTIDTVIAHNKTIWITVENSILRYAEYFKDFPQGHIVFGLEMDDIFEIRKKFPNVCVAGGMKTELLGYGNPQKCVDYAKRLVEELGESFIFGQDKMISFRSDCKRENLLAVTNFVRNYRC
jgi:hypothetical protein